MVSTWFLTFVPSIFLCGIVISKVSTLATGNSPIPLSELIEELRREPDNVRLVHLSYIFLVESYGDHVYDLSKTLSAECLTKVKANSLMFENLAICELVADTTSIILANVAKDMENITNLDEHPLELWCRLIGETYASQPLNRAFEKAKNEVAKFSSVSSRLPYYNKLLKPDSIDPLTFEMVDKYTVPEFARLMAVTSFLVTSKMQFTNSTRGCATCRYIFAKSCQAMAGQEKIADSMQNIFAKVVNETIADIGVADRHERRKASMDEGGFWWISKMMKAMYSYIVNNPSLKTELEKSATKIRENEGAGAEDLDFSKL